MNVIALIAGVAGLALLVISLPRACEKLLEIGSALIVFAVMVAISTPAQSAEAAPEAAEVFVIVKRDTLVKAIALLEAQADEIVRLRERVKKAEQPKECI